MCAIAFWYRRKPQDVEPGVGKWVSYLNREKKLDSLVGPRPVPPVAPRGLYLYGNVGSGKISFSVSVLPSVACVATELLNAFVCKSSCKILK